MERLHNQLGRRAGGMEGPSHIRNTLARIESFLLPPNPALAINEPLRGFPSTPVERLDQVLLQLAVADHVRSMQTIYRDAFDEQLIAFELRGSESAKDRIPTKELLHRLVEGRARAIALLKLCCGPHSIASVRGCIDLANAYALQGMWQQAEDRVLTAMERLVEVEAAVKSTDVYALSRRLGMDAAKRISLVFSCLRRHVVRNCGQVRQTLLKELLHDLGDVVASDNPDMASLPHPSKLFTSLADFFAVSSSKHPLKKLTKSYFADQDQVPRQHNNPRPEEVKTWGDIVEFLRNKCEPMRAWIQSAVSLLLPQTKAQLALPFLLCDPAGRKLAHPVQLANALQVFPSVAKLVAGTQLAKVLVQARTEVPLVVNSHTGSVQALPRLDPAAVQAHGGVQGVFYELPMAMEEYLCAFLLQASALSLDQQFSLLKVQALTLQGICSLHLSTPQQAEEVLLKALQEVDTAGLEGEAAACELYNSIAQMMITKFQNHVQGRRERLRAAAEVWVQDTEEGRRAVRLAQRSVKKQFSYRSKVISTAEMELLAKDQVVAHRIKALQEEQEANEASDPMRQNLEAAYRYLVKSFEIAEATHGALHPVVGTACLAVASVQNLLRDLESTREWLLRSIRIFEKVQPTPHRAITFAQTQLAHALMKLGHEDEARRVLNKAGQFHLATARAMLAEYLAKSKHGQGQRQAQGNEVDHDEPKPDTARSAGSSVGMRSVRQQLPFKTKALEESLWPVILKGTPLYEEIQTSVALLNQVGKMCTHVGEKWEASLLAEEVARLLDEAYGWDSMEAAEATKQVGQRCLGIEDWPRAVRFLSLSLQAHAALFSKTDARYIAVAKLLEEAKTSRAQGAHGLLGDDDQAPPAAPVSGAVALNGQTSGQDGDDDDSSTERQSGPRSASSQSKSQATGAAGTVTATATTATSKPVDPDDEAADYDYGDGDFLISSPER